MPTTTANKTLVEQSSDVQALRNQSANTALQASGLEGQAFTLGDEVMKAVQADRQARGVSQIATQVGATTSQLASDPEAIRARTSGMVAPTQVNALTSGARAFNMGTLAEQATQQSLNQGSLDNIIQAGANQLKARAQQMMAQAQQESSKADALMESLKFKADEEARAFSEQMELSKFNKDSEKKVNPFADFIEMLKNQNTGDDFTPDEIQDTGGFSENPQAPEEEWNNADALVQMVASSPLANTLKSKMLNYLKKTILERLTGSKGKEITGGTW